MRFLLYFLTIFQITALIVMISVGAVHTNRYTYWNFTLSTLFLLFLSVGYLYHEHRLSRLFVKVLTVFFLPMIFGSISFVLVYIIIVLQMDDGWQLLAATILGGGSLSLGSVHTFDWLIHSGPLVVILIVLWTVYGHDASGFVIQLMNTNPRKIKTWHALLYCYAAPFLPIGLYLIFFNPIDQYPTSSPYLTIGLGIISYFIIMTLFFFTMISNQLSTFLPDIQRREKLSSFFSE